MNTTELKPGDRWVYVGPGDGKNEIHRIADIEQNGEGVLVTTWGFTEHSWHGTLLDFLHQFRLK